MRAFLILYFCQLGFAWNAYGQSELVPEFTEYPVNCSIRALEVVSEEHIWFAGSNGMFGWTMDGGDTWTIDSIKVENKAPEFRSIAVTDNAVFLLSIATPAYLFKSEDRGENWRLVHQDNHPEVFYDSMKFWDDQNGIAVGDPLNGCLSVLITRDGGDSWQRLDCARLPPAFEGEAAFAASNTNISVYGSHTWLVSGVTKARAFYSSDKGRTWEAFDTPIVEGGKMTGIFSVDFHNEQHGIIFGGDWEDKSMNTSNKAITKDGGRTWELIADGQYPGYRSCVQFIPNTGGKGILAVGIPAISYSADGGNNWQNIDKEYYYTIRVAPSGRHAWLAGKNKIAKMTW